MDVIDPTDASTVPVDARDRVLSRLVTELERALADERIHLDYFGRLELLELALDDLEERFTEHLPPVREN
jgi:hypothetical protein